MCFLDYIPLGNFALDLYKEMVKQSLSTGIALNPPLYALLKVTERCNSSCFYCGHRNKKLVENEACTENWYKVIEQIAELGCISVNFSGGEPLLRNDLFKLITYAKGKGLFTILLTNGILLKQNVKKLKKAGLDMLIVSVDTISEDNFIKNRGVGLNSLLEDVEFAKREIPITTITSVITWHNLKDLPELVEYFTKRQIGVQFSPYHYYGPGRKRVLSYFNKKEYKEIIEILIELKSEGKLILNSYEYLENLYNFNFYKRGLPSQFKCLSCYTSIFIDFDLSLRSCWDLEMPITRNLKKHKLINMWYSKKFNDVRKKIKRIQCKKCWLLCTSEPSIKWGS